MTGTIKVNSNGKVFFSRVVKSGPVQIAFGNTFRAYGKCIGDATKNKSHTKKEKVKILKGCMETHKVEKGMKLTGFTANAKGYYTRKRTGQVGGGQEITT